MVLFYLKRSLICSRVRLDFWVLTLARVCKTPINRSLYFVNRFPTELKDKTQLQRFLGCLNYVYDFIPNIRTICLPLFIRLKKNPPPWDDSMTGSVRQLK